MKKRMKRLLSAGICLCMALNMLPMTVNAEKSTTVSQAEGTNELAVSLGADPISLDPALCMDTSDSSMISTAFEGLTMNGEMDQIVSGCADYWNISGDGLTWEFTLKEGLKWSDGSPLTAEDFEYSWKRVCDPELGAPYAATVLWMVDGFEEAMNGNTEALAVTAVDDLTLRVELSQPCEYFAQLAAFPTLYPVQKEAVEASNGEWALSAENYVTNGAFYISEWVEGSHIIMTKNENYWNAGDIKLDSIKFVLSDDADTVYSAYENGELQFIKNIPIEVMENAAERMDFYSEQIIGTYYLSFNTQAEPLTDVNVRKALAIAIDREYISSEIMDGAYMPAYNIVGPGWLDTDGTQFIDNANGGESYISQDYEANVNEAKQLLAEAGYTDGLELTYKTNDSGFHVAVAEYLQQAWAKIGVTLTIETMEWGPFLDVRHSGDFEIARNGWVGDYLDPSGILEIFYSENENNDSQYVNEELDAALEQASVSMDREERSNALHTVEDILMENMVCCPVAYYTDYWLESEDVIGIWHSAMGTWCFKYAEVIGEPVYENPFTDVEEGKYYYEPVLWAVENGITNGMTPDSFEPDRTCTRAQIVTFIWRAYGSPDPEATESQFTDVVSGSFYEKAVLWAVENGITSGTTATTFDPGKECTREQTVTFLWRAEGKPVQSINTNPFTDINPNRYAYKAILWAVEEGITNGMTPTTFEPSKQCTRGQVVTFLSRAVKDKLPVAEQYVYELAPGETVYVENLAFNEDVTIYGDEAMIVFVNCEFNEDIINTSQAGTRVFLLGSEVNGICYLANGKKEAVLEDDLPKIMSDTPIEVVCEDCYGVAVALGDFEIVFNNEIYTIEDSDVYYDYEEEAFVEYTGQEANIFVVAQWWEAGEKRMYTQCEYDPGM